MRELARVPGGQGLGCGRGASPTPARPHSSSGSGGPGGDWERGQGGGQGQQSRAAPRAGPWTQVALCVLRDPLPSCGNGCCWEAPGGALSHTGFRQQGSCPGPPECRAHTIHYMHTRSCPRVHSHAHTHICASSTHIQMSPHMHTCVHRELTRPHIHTDTNSCVFTTARSHTHTHHTLKCVRT